MCMKLPLEVLNSSPYLPHPINTYTYGVTMVSMNLTIGRFVHESQVAYHVITTPSINILGFKKYLKDCMFVLFFFFFKFKWLCVGYSTISCFGLTLNLQLHGTMAGSKQNIINFLNNNNNKRSGCKRKNSKSNRAECSS